ncbi:hypothetical protein BDAG_00232 [Burkholderia dolosa AU0158]|nr:hypothetical protein BDAG_00232 [Burkholderia dolosa AU0158]
MLCAPCRMFERHTERAMNGKQQTKNRLRAGCDNSPLLRAHNKCACYRLPVF